MTIECLKQVPLDCTTGGSDKVYIIQVQKIVTATGAIEYAAIGYYGARSGKLKPAVKYKGSSLAMAHSEADKIETDKRTSSKSRYLDMPVAAGTRISGMPADAPVFGGASGVAPAGAPAAAAPVAPTGPSVMLGTVTNEEDLEAKLADPDWVVQQKYDGERFPISLRRSGIVGYNRDGHIRPLSAGVMAAMTKLLMLPDFSDERETLVDGEIMGDTYVVYDILTLRDNDVRLLPFEERYCALEELLVNHQGLLAYTAWSTEEKRALKEKAILNDWEGFMARRRSASYTAGRSKDLVKGKLWATATCRVLTVNTKRSIGVALLDDAGDEVYVGNVSVPVNQAIPEPDDLVEVRYLYAHDGGKLYQPTLLRVRTDVAEADKRSGLRKAPPEKRGKASSITEAIVADLAEVVES